MLVTNFFSEINVNDPRSSFVITQLSSSEIGLKISGLTHLDSNTDLCNTSAVLHQLSHQAPTESWPL